MADIEHRIRMAKRKAQFCGLRKAWSDGTYLLSLITLVILEVLIRGLQNEFIYQNRWIW